MKYQNLQCILAVSGLLLISLVSASAQFSVNGGSTHYNSTREYNPQRMNFSQAWDWKLSDPVKLIDVAPVLNDREANLLLLVDSKQKADYRRKLVVTHWDGFRFVTDTSIDFFGATLDSLLAGRFRAVPKPATVTPVADKSDKKVKRPAALPIRQIATTEGIYQWTGGTLARLYSAPPNLRLALTQDGSSDQMVINSGDNAVIYEAGDTDVHPSDYTLTGEETGYPRFAIGAQPYDGMKEFLPGVRYVQTYFNGHYRWQIGVLRGKSTNNRDLPDATTGDRLVVYVPRAENKDKPFVQLIRTDQYEEAWRSPPVPGRILDVRVGDPKREGKSGILVLTAENDDKDHHLYYFTPIEGARPR
jgi:hypothetical protein